ncbi:TPA: hypothetical protein QDC51_004821 [Burkholderia multivorans]|uniref:hypothetical protein n=1 Tax=Burkholderia multivorans TaxID=87883 RepID=UPI001C219735|nr:hypothetical protein [Burkholderia multivorans]MBU9349954.1 hypothetical protein [Burkholderia multivorans]MBU9394656.1 hypothetical protein [Burkholderia multivorans]HDR9837977.1 hypothetical protein [Burkholderia multivorans]HDR9843606.1 hypothetical protein [Burkholderia multivorans]HDR9850669.1 hypothetical protein [Burkholderia multivorans]
MDTIAIMHDGADCCRERAAVMPYVGGSGGTDQDLIKRRGRLAEGRSSVGGRSASVRDGRPHRQRLAAEPADVLTNRDSGNARSCRLASRDCLAPRERESPFDDIRRFKLREEAVTVKVARCRVLLDTVPPGTIGTDCSEHVGRTGEATHARRFPYADASATDYRLGAAARRDATLRGQR